MKIIFIAGPLTTGFDGNNFSVVENNINEAKKYQIALANLGIGAYCSHTHTLFRLEKDNQASDEYFRQLDKTILEKSCDAILAMPGYEKSQGALAEVAWANKNNIPVFYPKSPKDLTDIVSFVN